MKGCKRIEEYGVIGNLETCVLVGRDGSIDWGCFPYLDSPSLFSALLDDEKGGRFSIRPAGPFESTIAYIPETNVLQTHFVLSDARMALTDFMPVRGGAEVSCRTVFRRLFCTEGEVKIEIAFEPAFDYGRRTPRFYQDDGGIGAEADGESLWLQSPLPLGIHERGAHGKAILRAGKIVWFAMHYGRDKHVFPEDCEAVLKKTVTFWTDWARTGAEERIDFERSWRDAAVRSNLALKLLTHPDTGAIAAAGTTSLPEVVGGVRNWDYRYSWVRDAAFTVQALHDMGHKKAAEDYFGWIRSICGESFHPSAIRVCYGLDGKPVPEEENIETLQGYRGSRPVRVGNAASHQFQLDIYGELVNALYETISHGERPTEWTWTVIRSVIDYVCEKWKEPDAGIWEMRKAPAHYTYSKLMCWVAIDRGLRIAKEFSFPHFGQMDEGRVRDTPGHTGPWVQPLDRKLRSSLRFPPSRCHEPAYPRPWLSRPKDPRVLGTIEATVKELTKEGLVYRYRVDDGLPGREPPFVLCSFWLVDALILAGQLRKAQELFENIIHRASPAGLYGEEIDPSTGEHRGNYPQGFSHVGLINSAFYLARARKGEPAGPEVNPAHTAESHLADGKGRGDEWGTSRSCNHGGINGVGTGDGERVCPGRGVNRTSFTGTEGLEGTARDVARLGRAPSSPRT